MPHVINMLKVNEDLVCLELNAITLWDSLSLRMIQKKILENKIMFEEMKRLEMGEREMMSIEWERLTVMKVQDEADNLRNMINNTIMDEIRVSSEVQFEFSKAREEEEWDNDVKKIDRVANVKTVEKNGVLIYKSVPEKGKKRPKTSKKSKK